MSEHPNAELYRTAFVSFMSGEGDASGIADDIVWWQIGSSEPLLGKEAVRHSMRGFPGEIEFNADIHDVVANDEHVVALINVSISTGGETFRYRTAEICHVDNGRITERWAFSDDTEAIKDFFARLSG
jgi:uncharacterized protein